MLSMRLDAQPDDPLIGRDFRVSIEGFGEVGRGQVVSVDKRGPGWAEVTVEMPDGMLDGVRDSAVTGYSCR
jgi:hypothetical protein